MKIMTSTLAKYKNILLVLGVCFFLLGCSDNLQFKEMPTLTINSSATSENPECSSITVENELPLPNQPENYRGKIFNVLGLPSGLELVSGSLIDNSGVTLIHVIMQDNPTHLVWLTKMKCRYDDIQDVLVLPVMNENEGLVIRYCKLNGQDDPEILAVGEFTPGTVPMSKVEYVWRANRKTNKFEVMSSNGVECF
jgi:hypothetical protein